MQERIPGSRFFDMDKVADTSSDLPHMLPPVEVFAAAADSLGIRKDDTVVVYDRAGIFSAPRVWWTFKALGHARSVHVSWVLTSLASSKSGVLMNTSVYGVRVLHVHLCLSLSDK